MTHLSLALEVHERAHLVLEWDQWIDTMQLQQVDPLHAESAQAHLGLLAQELRAAERVPLVRAGAYLTGFGGDDQVVGIRVERFADQLLADIGPVRIRSIDQGDDWQTEFFGQPH